MAKPKDDLYGMIPSYLGLAYPELPDFKMPKLRDFDEEAAEKFMRGLAAQVRLSGAKLKENEQVVMYCWHGHERLRVLRISMPSHNVVAMHCLDAEGCATDVTGHIHSTNFSIRVQTVLPPAVRTLIGFEMPNTSS